MAADPKKPFRMSNHYDIRTRQKLDALRATGLFNDNIKIIETAIDLLYERLLMGELSQSTIEILSESIEEKPADNTDRGNSNEVRFEITRSEYEQLDPIYRVEAEKAIINGHLTIIENGK